MLVVVQFIAHPKSPVYAQPNMGNGITWTKDTVDGKLYIIVIVTVSKLFIPP